MLHARGLGEATLLPLRTDQGSGKKATQVAPRGRGGESKQGATIILKGQSPGRYQEPRGVQHVYQPEITPGRLQRGKPKASVLRQHKEDTSSVGVSRKKERGHCTPAFSPPWVVALDALSKSTRLPENQIRQKQAKSRQLRCRKVGRRPVAQGERESSNSSRTQEGKRKASDVDSKSLGSSVMLRSAS